MAPKSPLAPERFPDMPPIAGVRLGSAAAGIRYRARADVTFVEVAPGTRVAGVLTTSKLPGAPVEWCRRILPAGRARALVVNAGNANVFTGAPGATAVRRTARTAAKLVGCAPEEIFVSSTGVIGEPLPVERITNALPALHGQLRDDAWHAAANAIMTTDTFPKGATRQTDIGGTPITINGIAKGSGMIAPNMATMLAYIFTDARLPVRVLGSLLRPANARSFNAITVDSDTSTSDTCLLFATGAGPAHPGISRVSDPRLRNFTEALEDLMVDLAHQIVRDGEGATKFVSIAVKGAASDAAAHRLGMTVANSPLVKTAIAGEDANWGRLIAAVGKSDEAIDRDRLSIRIGKTVLVSRGRPDRRYDEAEVAQHLKGQEIDIGITIGSGRGKATVWTCDLTHGYIDINAHYRS